MQFALLIQRSAVATRPSQNLAVGKNADNFVAHKA
jgi:hypothetical protein